MVKVGSTLRRSAGGAPPRYFPPRPRFPGRGCYLAGTESSPNPFGSGIFLVNGMKAINRIIEAIVRQRPDQYIWSYNRYKTPHAEAHAKLEAAAPNPSGQADGELLGKYRVGEDAGRAEKPKQQPQPGRQRDAVQRQQQLSDQEQSHPHCRHPHRRYAAPVEPCRQPPEGEITGDHGHRYPHEGVGYRQARITGDIAHPGARPQADQ